MERRNRVVVPYSKIIFLGISLFAMLSEASGLKCYQCLGYMTNEQCNVPDNLLQCKDESALVYDVCESKVTYTEHGQHITKRCAKGPCTLETKNQNSALDIANCNENVCQYCCYEDGCNVSGALARMRTQSSILLPSMSVVGLVLCFRWIV